MDFLVKYYRMKNAIVFKMSNDILQVRSIPPLSLEGRELTSSFVENSSISMITRN